MDKSTERSKLVRQKITENNGAISKRSLAKLLHQQYPKQFKSEESARDAIRYATGNSGKVHRVNATKVDWEIPEGDECGYEDFILPLSSNNVLVLTDIHFPYHNKKNVEKALNEGLKQGCNAIYLNGDTLDFHKGSVYAHEKSYKEMAEEVEYFKIFISELKKNFDVPIYFKIGNHEVRWERMLRENPQFNSFEEFQLSSILKFGENNITEVKSKQETRCGKFSLWHGHEFHGSGGIDPAKWLFERTLRSGACGHFHRHKSFIAYNGTENIETYSMGCLSELRPNFMPHQRATQTWVNGYGILNWDKEHFEFQNIIIK